MIIVINIDQLGILYVTVIKRSLLNIRKQDVRERSRRSDEAKANIAPRINHSYIRGCSEAGSLQQNWSRAVIEQKVLNDRTYCRSVAHGVGRRVVVELEIRHRNRIGRRIILIKKNRQRRIKNRQGV